MRYGVHTVRSITKERSKGMRWPLKRRAASGRSGSAEQVQVLETPKPPSRAQRRSP